MRASLAVPFADASAAALGWCLTSNPRPALATLVVTFPTAILELGILGASHQVRFEVGDVEAVEVVACGLDEASLPATVDRALGGHVRYRFRSDVERLGRGTFARRVDAIVRAAERDEQRSLVGVFPGAATAVTVLTAIEADGHAGWRTWHAYPQTGELVVTTSEVR